MLLGVALRCCVLCSLSGEASPSLSVCAKAAAAFAVLLYEFWHGGVRLLDEAGCMRVASLYHVIIFLA